MDVAYMQAHMLVDMSMVVIAHYKDLDEMPTGAPVVGNRTAAIDMKELLIHGAKYLLACWDNATSTIVTHVATNGVLDDASAGVEWIAPEQVSRLPSTPIPLALDCFYC
jgi:hypothetical protein